jgi:hypothetical protein
MMERKKAYSETRCILNSSLKYLILDFSIIVFIIDLMREGINIFEEDFWAINDTLNRLLQGANA